MGTTRKKYNNGDRDRWRQYVCAALIQPSTGESDKTREEKIALAVNYADILLKAENARFEVD